MSSSNSDNDSDAAKNNTPRGTCWICDKPTKNPEAKQHKGCRKQKTKEKKELKKMKKKAAKKTAKQSLKQEQLFKGFYKFINEKGLRHSGIERSRVKDLCHKYEMRRQVYGKDRHFVYSWTSNGERKHEKIGLKKLLERLIEMETKENTEEAVAVVSPLEAVALAVVAVEESTVTEEKEIMPVVEEPVAAVVNDQSISVPFEFLHAKNLHLGTINKETFTKLYIEHDIKRQPYGKDRHFVYSWKSNFERKQEKIALKTLLERLEKGSIENLKLLRKGRLIEALSKDGEEENFDWFNCIVISEYTEKKGVQICFVDNDNEPISRYEWSLHIREREDLAEEVIEEEEVEHSERVIDLSEEKEAEEDEVDSCLDAMIEEKEGEIVPGAWVEFIGDSKQTKLQYGLGGKVVRIAQRGVVVMFYGHSSEITGIAMANLKLIMLPNAGLVQLVVDHSITPNAEKKKEEEKKEEKREEKREEKEENEENEENEEGVEKSCKTCKRGKGYCRQRGKAGHLKLAKKKESEEEEEEKEEQQGEIVMINVDSDDVDDDGANFSNPMYDLCEEAREIGNEEDNMTKKGDGANFSNPMYDLCEEAREIVDVAEETGNEEDNMTKKGEEKREEKREEDQAKHNIIDLSLSPSEKIKATTKNKVRPSLGSRSLLAGQLSSVVVAGRHFGTQLNINYETRLQKRIQKVAPWMSQKSSQGDQNGHHLKEVQLEEMTSTKELEDVQKQQSQMTGNRHQSMMQLKAGIFQESEENIKEYASKVFYEKMRQKNELKKRLEAKRQAKRMEQKENHHDPGALELSKKTCMVLGGGCDDSVVPDIRTCPRCSTMNLCRNCWSNWDSKSPTQFDCPGCKCELNMRRDFPRLDHEC